MSISKDKLTKYTAYYRCPDRIENFKIRIRYKEVNDDYITRNNGEDWRVLVISWQEKHFSKTERDFYGDIHNCFTDLEKKYHEIIVEEEEQNDATLFTYVEEDEYISEQEAYNKPTYLQSVIESIKENSGNFQCQDDYDYIKYLISSTEKTVVTHDIKKMYVMADLGEYVENIWIKNEQHLCDIKYDKNTKMLAIYPDFSTTKPYHTKIQGETVRQFYYFIENCSGNIPENIAMTEKDLLKKLTHCRMSLKRQLLGDTFYLPPKNKLYVYLFFEILSAKNFEYSDIYVQYYIDLPEHWTCENPNMLKGATQLSHGVNEELSVNFGHCFDVTLEYDIQSLQDNGFPKTPYIYFEVISKTTWDRFRTEGLAYKNLPVSNPGFHFYSLSCFRLMSGTTGDLRRFFIGDCSKYKDIRWIGIPNEIEGTTVNKFGANTVGTGQLDVRLNVLHQSQAFLDEYNERNQRQKLIYEKLNSSSLIKSVEQVLKAFRKARRNMMEARKNL